MLQIYLPRQYTIYFTKLPRHQKILNLISTANTYLFGNTDRKISNTEFHIAFYEYIFLSYQLKMQGQGIAANKIYAVSSIQLRVIVTMTKKYLIKITKATC